MMQMSKSILCINVDSHKKKDKQSQSLLPCTKSIKAQSINVCEENAAVHKNRKNEVIEMQSFFIISMTGLCICIIII